MSVRLQTSVRLLHDPNRQHVILQNQQRWLRYNYKQHLLQCKLNNAKMQHSTMNANSGQSNKVVTLQTPRRVFMVNNDSVFCTALLYVNDLYENTFICYVHIVYILLW